MDGRLTLSSGVALVRLREDTKIRFGSLSCASEERTSRA
jgi:hypothetical protein